MAGLVAGAACSAGEDGVETETDVARQPAGSAAGTIVFNSEDNRLNAYDAETFALKQTVIPNAAEGGLDINAQVCFHTWEGRTFFIAGEDTGQTAEGSPGWGWFELSGNTVGSLSVKQRGKLRPTWAPGRTGQPENYGCGFLPDGMRLITTDVGDQLPQETASGQLLVWFLAPAIPASLGGFSDGTTADLSTSDRYVDNSLDTNYCKIDTAIGTAGGSWVHDGWVYVASNRPGPNGPGGIYRYEIADFPANNGCHGLGTEADLVAAGKVTRELWHPSDVFVPTPSAIAPTGRTYLGLPTFYISSVFTGVIAEYVDLGGSRAWLRNVVEPPGGAPIGQLDLLPENTDGTPFGIGITPNGDLWYADMGIVGDGPADARGSVQRVRFDSAGNVVAHDTVDENLLYPDGIGIFGAGTFATADAPTQALDLAQGRPVTCASGSPAAHLVDGDELTATEGNLSCVVDLEHDVALEAVRIRWGDYDDSNVFPCNDGREVSAYSVEISDDQSSWVEITRSQGVFVPMETLSPVAGVARYVRLRATSDCSATAGAYSFSVFGSVIDAASSATP